MTITELLNTRLDGVVRAHSCSVRLEQTGTGKDDPQYRLDIKVDFTGWMVQSLCDMAIRPLVIMRQKVWAKMTPEQIKLENGRTFLASDMGKKPHEVVDVEAAFKARFRVADAETRAKILAELEEMK